MKRINLLCLFVGLLLLGFIACQKELSPDNLVPPIITSVADSIFISKIYIIDSTTNVEDTGEIVTFIYDNLKRVTNIYDSAVVPAGVIPFQFTTFFYNSNDTLPYKLYRVTLDATVGDTTTQFFYYDASARRVRDSSFNSFGDINGSFYRQKIINATYQYPAGMIIGYSRDTTIFDISGPNPPANITKDTASIDANNNLLSNIKDQNSLTRLESTLTYTTHPNVFHNLNARYNFDVFPRTSTELLYATRDNTSHIVSISSSSGSANTTYEKTLSYTYNAEGNVEKVITVDPAYAGTYFKSVFVYRVL